MNETFICNDCRRTGHLNTLRHRITATGDYCPPCADLERCAACGETYPLAFVSFKTDVNNIICNSCEDDYQEVKNYIKPVYSMACKAA